MKKAKVREYKRYVVIAQNLTQNKEQWRGKFDTESASYDACYRLATSEEWSVERTKSHIVFIVFDTLWCKEIDRYHNQ